MSEVANQRVMLTKRLLKDALLELLKTTDIHRLSIRELCLAAGINRSTFYKHYGSQFDVLDEIIEDFLVQIETQLYTPDPASAAQPPTYISFENLVTVLKLIEERRDLCLMLFTSDESIGLLQRLFDRRVFREIVDDQFPEMESPEFAEYRYAFVVDGSISIIKLWINKEKRESPAELARIISTVVGGNQLSST